MAMSITVHHVNAGSLRPLSARFMNGVGPWLGRGSMVCHALIIETGGRLVLVDAGIGLCDIDAPGRFGAVFDRVAAPAYDRNEAVASRVVAMGYGVGDVTDVVVTHLDMDHAGGIADLPRARVHVSVEEFEVATRREDAASRARYVERQMDAVNRWVVYAADYEPDWFGFPVVGVVDIDGLDARLIALPGHSPGHCGVAIRRGDRWLLHAGDAFYDRRQIEGGPVPAGIRAFAAAVAFDRKAVAATLAALQRLRRDHGDRVDIVCAHDARDLAERTGGAGSGAR